MSSTQQWTWSSLRNPGHTRTGGLWLYWSVDGEAMSDDYLFEDADAVDLWQLWAESAAKDHGDLVPIEWFITDHARPFAPAARVPTYEPAPFQVHPYRFLAGNHFLKSFTWPVSVEGGDRLNWLSLPVAEKRWSAEQPDKGGFISEALGGWKPSPLQPMVSISALARCAGLGHVAPSTEDPAGVPAHLEVRDAAVVELDEVLMRLKAMPRRRRPLSQDEQLMLRSDAARLARVAQSLYYVAPD
jgi:hypothetical protein